MSALGTNSFAKDAGVHDVVFSYHENIKILFLSEEIINEYGTANEFGASKNDFGQNVRTESESVNGDGAFDIEKKSLYDEKNDEKNTEKNITESVILSRDNFKNEEKKEYNEGDVVAFALLADEGYEIADVSVKKNNEQKNVFLNNADDDVKVAKYFVEEDETDDEVFEPGDVQIENAESKTTEESETSDDAPEIYSFVMPECDVEITAELKEKENNISETGTEVLEDETYADDDFLETTEDNHDYLNGATDVSKEEPFDDENEIITDEEKETFAERDAAQLKKASAKEDETKEQSISIIKIKFAKTNIVLATKSKINLKPTVTPANATDKIIWKSSDDNIASVDDGGCVTANRYGSATITATSSANGKIKATIKINTKYYDVNNEQKYYYKPVYWAADKGIARGFDNVFFGPERKCTRCDMAILLWRFAGRPNATGSIGFKDIKYKTNSDSYKAIRWAKQKGIINGYSDGTFKPESGITRQDALIMLYRFAGRPFVSGSISFKDVVSKKYSKKSDTYKAIIWGTNIKVTGGYSDGNFKPLSACLREHVVTFLYKYNNVKNNGYGTGLYNVSGKWKYYENGVFRPATGLVKRASDGKWFYVENGVLKQSTGLVKRLSDGKWFYVEKGAYKQSTGLVKRVSDGKWFYVDKGAFKKSTGLVQKVGTTSWYYVKDGAFNNKTTGLVKRVSDGKWFYVKNGAFNNKTTGLVKRVTDGKWFYVEKGAFKQSTGLANKVGTSSWYYVKNGEYKKTTGFEKKLNSSDDKWHYYSQGGLVAESKTSATVKNILSRLNASSRKNKASWNKIVKHWNKVNESGYVNTSAVPANLPNDNSLCIVVLGYQLNANGSMQKELTNRLDTAIKIAKKYPKSYVLVTGGGTAANSGATEAGQMAAYLKKKGIASSRIIIENKSYSTIENAVYSYKLIKTKYKKIKKVVMVTSDYHLPMGSLLFEARFVLEAAKDGTKEPVEVFANYGNKTGATPYSLLTQANWLWWLESY